MQDRSGSAAPLAKRGSAASAGTMGFERPVSNIHIASTSGPKKCAVAKAGPTLPVAEHIAVAASSVQQEAAMMATKFKTFASRWPPNEEMLPEAKAAWDAMVLGFYMEKVEARIAGRKRSMSQKEWWNMRGHTLAKQRKILKKPSVSVSNRIGEEGEDAEAPPVSAEEDEHKEDDEEKGEESEEMEQGRGDGEDLKDESESDCN